MKTLRFFIIALAAVCSTLTAAQLSHVVTAGTAAVDPVSYFKSFVLRREFSTAGRHAGGYHTYFLEDTANSLKKLENQMANEGFSLNKRMVIMGYERNALPSYFTCYRHCTGDIINDEVLVRTASGWTIPLHNKYGLMTGFLLRKAPAIGKEPNEERIFEHVSPQRVEIFHDMMDIFQENAFGAKLNTLIKATERAILPSVQKGDVKTFLACAEQFWSLLYKKSECAGDAQVAGTQDILFSVAHAGYLRSSRTPIKKFFTGGDVTYPITPSTRCNKNATKNSQEFAMHFVQYLKPVNNKKTVYVFNSFVDGVGKSTMLGNIKNYMKHGKNLDDYEKTDNTSSQTADIWEFAPDVFIADLPAQVSHFMIKPDGDVYVHVDAARLDQSISSRARQFAQRNIGSLKQKFESEIATAHTKPWSNEVLQDTAHPQRALAQNLVLLKKDKKNVWIPFTFEGRHYVYDHEYTRGLRVLVAIKDAESEGLKTIEAEQMLFTQGVRFPMPYQFFLDDLTNRLKEQGVEEVVFVDFLSMYSRSSRENIRVNYLLQQMALLDKKFNQDETLYRYFVTNAELFDIVRKKENKQSFASSLELEAQVRWALHNIMVSSTDVTLTGVDLVTLKDRIEKCIALLTPDVHETLKALAHKKVTVETAGLELQYGLAKEFVNVALFSFDEAAAFSDFVIDTFSKKVDNSVLEKLWSNLSSPLATSVPATIGDGPVPLDHSVLQLTTGEDVIALYVFGAQCRSGIILAPGLRALRGSWYATLSNLICAEKKGDTFIIDKIRSTALPVALKKGPDGRWYVVIKRGALLTFQGSKPPIDPIWGFGDAEKVDWMGYDDNINCPMPPKSFETKEGVYGFGPQKVSVYGSQLGFSFPQLDMYYYWRGIAKMQEQQGQDNVIPTSTFYKKMTEKSLCPWYSSSEGEDYSWIKWRVKENVKKLEEKQKEKSITDEIKEKLGDDEKQYEDYVSALFNKRASGHDIFPVSEQFYESSRFAIRALATLELVIKDPAGHIALRKDNQEDFEAALKLLEQVVVPQSFRMFFMEPLFSDYASERPVL